MIKAIFFDFSGVIATNKLEDQIVAFAKKAKVNAEKLTILEKENHDKMMLGKLSVKEFCSSVRSRFALKQDSMDLLLLWDKCYSENVRINTELLEKIKELKKMCKIGLVANMFDTTAQFHQRQNIFFYFKPLVISCRVGLKKPESEILQRAVALTGEVKASECLIIDDKEEDLVVAKKIGIKTLKYENNKKLFKDLKKLKLLK